MGHPKPYHRNIRPSKPGSLKHTDGYVSDPAYAKNKEQYVRAFKLIENDLLSIFEYIEPADECMNSYSYRIHALLMRTCIEVEANFKAILKENKFTPTGPGSFNMRAYRKIDFTHHLSDYKVTLMNWNGPSSVRMPFESWKALRGLPNQSGTALPWYDAYNASKHDRQGRFKEANLGHLVDAVAGLLVLISSQFSQGLSSLFWVRNQEDWNDDEFYEFDWLDLQKQTDRFAKFDYDDVAS